MFTRVNPTRYEGANGDVIIVSWSHREGASMEYQSGLKTRGFDKQSWSEKDGDQEKHIVKVEISRPVLWSVPPAQPMTEEESSRFIASVTEVLSIGAPTSEVRIHLSREAIPFAR